MSKSQNTEGSTLLAFILFIIFLILKLTGNIDWSWWWVTALLWIGAAVVIASIFSAIFLIFKK